MARPRGGYIGFNATATTAAASGVWTLSEAQSATRSGEWPIADVVGGGGGELTGFAVSGAGTSAVNGTYCPDGTYGGKTTYVFSGTEYSIRYEPDFMGIEPHWTIWDDVNFTYKYQVSSSADTPPLTGWGVFFGDAPAPTLSAASCP
jgi:hypothetical protein